MGDFPNHKRPPRRPLMAMVLNFWLKIFIVGLLLNWTPHASALTFNEERARERDPLYLASYSDVVQAKNSGLNEQRNHKIQSGEVPRNVLSFNVPQNDLPEYIPRNRDEDSAFRPRPDVTTLCDYHVDLQSTQDLSNYLPDGMPIFHVTFYNSCLNCPFTNIHIQCGDFASATLVDPNLFRKIGDNDCLLNNGAPLAQQQTIAFEYSSTFAFPMNVGLASPMC